MSDYPLLIHVGYHKTATTWLQNFVFNNSDIGFTSPWGKQSGLAVQMFVLSNPYKFSADRARAEFDGIYRDSADNGLLPVISNEALCGQPIGGGRFSYGKYVIDRLYETFPSARIFLMIREQKSSILSHYRQHIANGGRHSIKRYLGNRGVLPGFKPPCPFEHFEYDLYVAYIQNVFGKNNVLVLPFELFLESKGDFLNELCKFAGLPPCANLPESTPSRVGLKGAALGLRRAFNQVNFAIPNWSLPQQSLHSRAVGKMLDIVGNYSPGFINEYPEKKLRQAVSDAVGLRYAESNYRLSVLTGLPLEKYNYPVDKTE